MIPHKFLPYVASSNNTAGLTDPQASCGKNSAEGLDKQGDM
jgi:hypothetical protein